MNKWLYHEYIGLYGQYLSYLSSLLLILASAAAISIINIRFHKILVLILFVISFIIAAFEVVKILDVYKSTYASILNLSQCKTLPDDELSCDFNVFLPDLYWNVRFGILSFILLVLGHCIRLWKPQNEKKID